ncbi:MAG: hypothetical protein OEY89_10440 [Gammaproteobacteria bacterium]|nr:hypothetical protein [Gammaproteobacteria bacterium]
MQVATSTGRRELVLFFSMFVLYLLVANFCFAADMDKEKSGALINKLTFLENMAFKSVRAKHVEESGIVNGINLLNLAKGNYDKAWKYFQMNQYGQCDAEINKGIKNVTAAFKIVENRENDLSVAEKKYQRLLESIDSYIKSLQLISQEKGVSIEKLLAGVDIVLMIDGAKRNASSKMYGRAVAVLLEVEEQLERAITLAREKETIVYKLEFDNPESEYKYEMERNIKYQYLVGMLLKSSDIKIKSKNSLIKKSLDHNENVVSEAKTLFERGEINLAISTLEKGTLTLMRALRMAGMSL